MQLTYEQIVESSLFIKSKISIEPEIALILGTGLGAVADQIEQDVTIPYGDIPHFPLPTVSDHEGMLVFGKLSGKSVVAMQGRIHYYEGYPLERVTFPLRVMRLVGARILIINSATGGLNPAYRAGDVLLVEDHINLTGQNPLRGLTDHRFGDRFPDMSQPYCPYLMELAEAAALNNKIRLHRGVYVSVAGPSLETRAETRMLRLIGADCVGMSTVPEVITAVQTGFRVLALAAITNVNKPDCMEIISFEQVIANARVAETKMSAIIREVVTRLD